MADVQDLTRLGSKGAKKKDCRELEFQALPGSQKFRV